MVVVFLQQSINTESTDKVGNYTQKYCASFTYTVLLTFIVVQDKYSRLYLLSVKNVLKFVLCQVLNYKKTPD